MAHDTGMKKEEHTQTSGTVAQHVKCGCQFHITQKLVCHKTRLHFLKGYIIWSYLFFQIRFFSCLAQITIVLWLLE